MRFAPLSHETTSAELPLRQRLLLSADSGKRTFVAKFLAHHVFGGHATTLRIVETGVWPSSANAELFVFTLQKFATASDTVPTVNALDAGWEIEFSENEVMELNLILGFALYFHWSIEVTSVTAGVGLSVDNDANLTVMARSSDVLAAIREALG